MLTVRLRIIVAGLVAAAILTLGWIAGIAPQLEIADRAHTDRAAVEAQNEAHRLRLQTLKKQFDRIELTRADLADLRGVIPAVSDLPGFLDAASVIAASHSVTISEFSAAEPVSPAQIQAASPPLEPETPAESAPDAVAAGAIPDTAGSTVTAPDTLFAIPINMTLTGSADSVLAIIRDLQHHTRLFLVTSATVVTPTDDAAAGASSDSQINGFVYVVPH
ncbi:MAG TPA: hypothetical protein VGP24_16895 [Glaciihabitans sp.]|jgi:hypothetical protein|nr:hypothetical protein [Glaciihabitans sp.]